MTTALSEGDKFETLLSARRNSSSLPLDPDPDPFDDLPERLCIGRDLGLVALLKESLRGGAAPFCAAAGAVFEKSVTKFSPPHLPSGDDSLITSPNLASCSLTFPVLSFLEEPVSPFCLSLFPCCLLFSDDLALSSGEPFDEGGVEGERTSSPIGDENGRRGMTGGRSWTLEGNAF